MFMMKNNITQRTIKVKLNLTEEQGISIQDSMQDSVKIFDLFVELCCEHRSTSYQNAAQNILKQGLKVLSGSGAESEIK